MHRIDSDGHVDNLFVDEDANQAIAGTKTAADWLNAIQEELINILVAAEIDPNKASNDQLALAFQLLGGSKEWADILNKPTEFPAESHEHSQYALTHSHPYASLSHSHNTLGVNQTWSVSNYTSGANHFNNTGKPIYIILSDSLDTGGGHTCIIDGKAIFNEGTVGFIVPNGSYFNAPDIYNQIELS